MIEYSYDPPYNLWSGNRSDTLNKWKINYKGSIASASALPEKGDFKGDTYNVLEDGSNYMWNGNSWDKLDANVYVGATSETNGIRGLVPPATTAQIYSLLTGSGVWKSGAELGFAYDNAVVHLTGDEVINGQKTFTTSPITLKNNNVDYTENSISSSQYTTYKFKDVNNTDLGGMQLVRRDTGGMDNRIYCKNLDGSAECYLTCGFDSSGNKFAIAPSTDSNRDYGLDILTRDWIPKDTRIVHTTGDEEIDNYKYFTSAVILRNKNLQVGDTITTTQRRVIHFQDKANYSFGQIQSMIEANGLVSLVFLVSQNKTSNPSTGSIYFRVNANGSKDFFPSDTSTSLGLNNSNNRWGQIYSTSSTISTSDARLKSTPETVPSDVLDAWSEVDFVQFKMLDSVSKKGFDKARTHNGIIAQNIDEVFKKHNLDAFKYGLFCYDEWDAEEEVIGENGIVEKPALEAGDLYSLRYEEALCMEAAYQRRRAERAEARIKALEDRLEALEAKLA